MLDDKLCAVLLLDKMQQNLEILENLEVENMYIKNDVIFYKIKNSNIAVSKKLNNLDFSLLAPEDWDYLLTSTTKNELSQEFVEDSAKLYSLFIHDWSEKKSILAKIAQIINLKVLNNVDISAVKKNLKINEKILDLLFNNKYSISLQPEYHYENGIRYENEQGPEFKLDVNIDRVFNSIGDWERIEVLLSGTDNNINIIKNTIGEDNSIEDLNKVDLLLALLIIKYQTNKEEQIYKRYYRAMYKVRVESGIHLNADVDFIRWYKEQLTNALNINGGHYNVTPFHSILLESNRYRNSNRIPWDARREIASSIVTLNINYSAMTNEELLLFRKSVESIIDFHSKYISVGEKEVEAYILFLGRRVLEGKKKTKELLTTHLNLPNMYSEIRRRGL